MYIYPSVLQAVSGRGYAGCLDGCFQGYRGEAMQDLGYELRRTHIPRTSVNNPIFVTLLQKNHREFIGRCYTANPR